MLKKKNTLISWENELEQYGSQEIMIKKNMQLPEQVEDQPTSERLTVQRKISKQNVSERK